ncbi:MAG: MMPL family transporter [Solirubrobacteraceae bacterium]
MIRHRRSVIAVWVLALLFGGFAASGLGKLLSNRFSVPGTDAERGFNILRHRIGERGDGAFTLILQGGPATRATLPATAERLAQRGAAVVPGARAGAPVRASADVVFVQITTPLENAKAADKTPALRSAIGHPPGVRTYVSGFPAVNHDTQPIYNQDLARGELIAGLVALFVMGFMFGTVGALAVPFIFAFATIPTTLGLVWVLAHYMDMAIYVENIVTLIGIAIAIDYSMLVVYRYREELARGSDPHAALERTMATAGRATIFSGLTVAIGLGLLIAMPLPFMRSMGVGGVLVPLVSILSSATFLPALLAVLGRRVDALPLVNRKRLAQRVAAEGGFWSRLAHSIMRHPVPYFAGALGLMLALAAPALGLHVTGGDNRGVPLTTEATRGLKVLEDTVGPGALAPNQIVLAARRPGGALTPREVAAQRRLVGLLRSDPEVDPASVQSPATVGVALARRTGLLDATGAIAQIRAAGRHDSGTPQAIDLVHRIRDRYVPASGFAAPVYVSGAPAFGVDFVNRAYGAFPWLVLAVLIVSYLLLMRAFRSLFLPAKAVFMNLLSVSAAYGVIVLAFQHKWGTPFGLHSSQQIEAWIPIFLFAMTFGLSMDYEVFLLTRMREEWDHSLDNEHAVASGLEHTGRIITAAALIMIAAFSGFTAGSFVAFQEFGLGLSAAILLDATIVRMVLVPATMKLVGDWNWYMPARMRRVLRVPQPRERERAPASPGSAALPR